MQRVTDDMTADEKSAAPPPADAPARGRRRKQGEPTARQLAVPALVAFFSVVALVMFVYGFCNIAR